MCLISACCKITYSKNDRHDPGIIFCKCLFAYLCDQGKNRFADHPEYDQMQNTHNSIHRTPCHPDNCGINYSNQKSCQCAESFFAFCYFSDKCKFQKNKISVDARQTYDSNRMATEYLKLYRKIYKNI